METLYDALLTVAIACVPVLAGLLARWLHNLARKAGLETDEAQMTIVADVVMRATMQTVVAELKEGQGWNDAKKTEVAQEAVRQITKMLEARGVTISIESAGRYLESAVLKYKDDWEKRKRAE